MKAVCQREGLLAAFQVASTVVPQRSPRPILSNAKLVLSPGNRATLLATDLEIGIRYSVEGIECNEAAELVLPVAQIISILRELNDETIEISDSTGGIVLKGSSSRFDLQSEDPQQFPDVPDRGSEIPHTIKAGVLATMIRRTAFACASENSRYALHSVLLEFDDGKARMVATDSKRLALMHGPLESVGENTKGQWLIPPKALQLLSRILIDPDEEVGIILHDNDALFQTSRIMIYTRLVEGRYPKYQDVIPAECSIRIPLHVGQFHGAVRQARIVTSEESRGVDFSFNDGVLTMRSRANQIGESEVRLPIGYSGESVDLTYDPHLLIDALKVIDAEEEINLELVDPRKASVFRARDDFSYVVMPLLRER